MIWSRSSCDGTHKLSPSSLFRETRSRIHLEWSESLERRHNGMFCTCECGYLLFIITASNYEHLLTSGFLQMRRRKVHQVSESVTARHTPCVCDAVAGHIIFRRNIARRAAIRIRGSALTIGQWNPKGDAPLVPDVFATCAICRVVSRTVFAKALKSWRARLSPKLYWDWSAVCKRSFAHFHCAKLPLSLFD